MRHDQEPDRVAVAILCIVIGAVVGGAVGLLANGVAWLLHLLS